MTNTTQYTLPGKGNKLILMKGMWIRENCDINKYSDVKKEDMFPTSTDPKVKTPTQPKCTKLISYKAMDQKLYLGRNFIEGRADVRIKKAEVFQVKQWWNRHNKEEVVFEVEPNAIDTEECLQYQRLLKTAIGVMARSVWHEMYIEAVHRSEYDWLKHRSDGQLVKNWMDLNAVLNIEADQDQKRERMAEVRS